jgi:uncharacterized membrane-anchored protein
LSPKLARLDRFSWLALLGLVAVLVGFNYSVASKENVLHSGTVIKLALAPRDPRALLTGDYMALVTDVGRNVEREVFKKALKADSNEVNENQVSRRDGFAIVKPDDRGISQLVRVQESLYPVNEGELAVRFRHRDDGIRLGPNAFYFQEGMANLFEKARFGEYRLAASGELLLVHMLDEGANAIEAPTRQRPKAVNTQSPPFILHGYLRGGDSKETDDYLAGGLCTAQILLPSGSRK